MDSLYMSIIVPCYNAEKTIERCILSVLKQNHCKYELILVNDGSSDRTLEICEKYHNFDSRVKLLSHKNRGVSFSRNQGLRVACGDFILFLDADDWIENGFLEKAFVELSTNIDILYFGFNRVYADKIVYYSTIKEILARYDNDRKEFNPYVTRINGVVWGKFYKKELLKDILFNELLPICEDADFNYRVLKKAKNLVYWNCCGYNYLYSNSSTLRRYSPDFIDKSAYALKTINAVIEFDLEKESFATLVCNVTSILVINNFFHRDNPYPFREKLARLKDWSNDSLVCRSIEIVDLETLSKQQKFIIKCIQKNFYKSLGVLALVYNWVKKG